MLSLLTMVLLAQRPVAPPKSHNVLIENAWVKVIQAMNHPGDKSKMHKHDVNRVMIHLDAGVMRIAQEDGKIDDIKFQPGDVRWDPAGGLHTSENIGGADFHMIQVELKKPGDPAPPAWPKLDPVAVDPEHHKVEFENSQVRVIRQKVDPKVKTPLHEHVLPRVTVYLTEQRVYTSVASGRGSAFVNPAGKVSWGEKAVHAERNTGTAPFEVILVEIKSKGK